MSWRLFIFIFYFRIGFVIISIIGTAAIEAQLSTVYTVKSGNDAFAVEIDSLSTATTKTFIHHSAPSNHHLPIPRTRRGHTHSSSSSGSISCCSSSSRHLRHLSSSLSTAVHHVSIRSYTSWCIKCQITKVGVGKVVDEVSKYTASIDESCGAG